MDILSAALSLASNVFAYLNTEASKKYLDELVQAQKDLLDERAKGPERDDGLVEYLHQKIQILIQAAGNELARRQKP